MWGFKARDALATAFHGIWGAFWLAFGLVGLMAATRVLPINELGSAPVSFGWWLVVIAATTWLMTAAAFKESRLLGWFMLLVSIGATLSFIGDFVTGRYWTGVAGYFFLVSAILAWVLGSRLLLRVSNVTLFGRRREGVRAARISIGAGEPGVIRGQES
jgi:succinate-acetate transporter protein